MTNRKPNALSRMKQDYLRLKKDPIPFITAEPLPTNLLEWHYVVKGPEDTPYQGGYYHGTLLFPREFPFKPPSIYMFTPNGRFKTNTRLCLSISDFHPDTWNPTWSVGTILTGLLSFMLESTPTLGSTESSPYEKQQYAKKSLAFNLKNSNFRELFPQICDEINSRLSLQKQMLQASTVNNKLKVYPIQTKEIASDLDNKCGTNNSANNIDGCRILCSDFTCQNSISDTNFDENSIQNNAIVNNNTFNTNSPLDGYFNWHSIYSNLIAIISFAIFALIVNYVIRSLN